MSEKQASSEISKFVNSSGDDPWFLQFQLVSAELEKAEGDTRELKAALRQLMHCVEKGDKGWTLGDQLSLAKAYAKAEKLLG